MKMPATRTKDQQQQATTQRSAAQQGGKGLARPSVPALQQNLPQQSETQTPQRKRAGEDPAQLVQKQGVVQRAVKATVPNGTRIVIENVGASDLGDVGTIIRDSQIAGHKAVRFDNERDVLYRVHLNEMSPIDPALREEYAEAEPSSAMVRLARPVKITAEIDLSDARYQTADFYAYNGAHKIGKLKMNNTERAGFVISDVYSNLSPPHKVDGLGVLFLNIASRMAEILNKAVMTLAANRPPRENHPATFYARFGFDTPEFAVIAEEAAKAQKTFGDYMTTYMSTIHMVGSPAAVKHQTGQYLGGKGWGGPA